MDLEFNEKVIEPQEDVVDSQTEEINKDVQVNEDNLKDEAVESVKDESEEVVEPQQKKQSSEENKQFAKMRRKAEEEARNKLQKEREELEQARKEIEEMKRKQEEERIEKESIDSITYEDIQKVAYDMNVSEEYAKKLLVAEAKNEATKKKAEYYEQFNKIQQQKAELKDKPFFNELESDIDNMLKDNPSLEPKTAYIYLRGEKFDELISKQSSIKEKSMIANMQDKSRRKSVSSDGSTDSVPELSNFGKMFANFMGVDPREAAKIVKERNRRR